MTHPSPIVQEDFDALSELLDRATMRDVIRLFIDAAPARFDAVAEGTAAGDGAKVAGAFHTMRSTCGQLGAHRLEQYCAEGERAAKQGDFDGARARLADARAELDRCIAWFNDNQWLSD